MHTRRALFSIIAFFGLLAGLPAAPQHADKHPSGNNLPPGENVLWQDPGDVASLDFEYGIGGREMVPAPPFQFVSEDTTGTNPKIKVKDANGRTWSVKFGDEAKPSVFSTRLVWACGYQVEPEYLVAHGTAVGAHHLSRARKVVGADGSFIDGRFQLRSSDPKFLENANWRWTANPFLGTPQLNGLKILVMLTSNWDTKDARDLAGGSAEGAADSNLGIFQQGGQSGQPRYLFMMTDWGATMGKWGSLPGARSKGRCSDYAHETTSFVKGSDGNVVKFGWQGKHEGDIRDGIRVSDIQWLMQYLGRVTDDQLRRGFAASGFAPEEIGCYTESVRSRITQLDRVAH